MPFLLLKNNSIYKDDNSFTITMENSQVHANTVYTPQGHKLRIEKEKVV
ncbi:MAG: hypothetical protein HEQ10_17850 [Dolichospermum sp. DEX182a]|nr:hypothetical protein [Dolichospermum sp. DEX182a]